MRRRRRKSRGAVGRDERECLLRDLDAKVQRDIDEGWRVDMAVTLPVGEVVIMERGGEYRMHCVMPEGEVPRVAAAVRKCYLLEAVESSAGGDSVP